MYTPFQSWDEYPIFISLFFLIFLSSYFNVFPFSLIYIDYGQSYLSCLMIFSFFLFIFSILVFIYLFLFLYLVFIIFIFFLSRSNYWLKKPSQPYCLVLRKLLMGKIYLELINTQMVCMSGLQGLEKSQIRGFAF